MFFIKCLPLSTDMNVSARPNEIVARDGGEQELGVQPVQHQHSLYSVGLAVPHFPRVADGPGADEEPHADGET